MFIAIHKSTDQLVSGVDVMDPESLFSDADTYYCLLCSDVVEFNRGGDKSELFLHSNEKTDCFRRPQNSDVHQLGCEQAILTACNQLGYDRETVDIESDIKKGGASARADVIIEAPEPTVIEIYYRSRICGLHRKLDVILSNEYSCYIICVAPGKYNPTHRPGDFDDALQNYGPIEVGRFIPEYNLLTVGTRITQNNVDLNRTKVGDSSHYILGG